MRSVRLAGRGIEHDLDVAVVSRDDRHHSLFPCRSADAAQALIEHFHGLDRGSDDSRMADHVGIRVVARIKPY